MQWATGGSINDVVMTFSVKERTDMQRIAWEGLKQFEETAASGSHP